MCVFAPKFAFAATPRIPCVSAACLTFPNKITKGIPLLLEKRAGSYHILPSLLRQITNPLGPGFRGRNKLFRKGRVIETARLNFLCHLSIPQSRPRLCVGPPRRGRA